MPMGYVFTIADARAYQRWTEDPRNQSAIASQNRLMLEMLGARRGETLLDVGCGTGLRFNPFLEAGVNVSGVDPSDGMLDAARRIFADRADLHRGFAEDLPFDDNSFNYAVMVLSLEFVDDSAKAIEEACRVAKDRIFIGVLNRYALKNLGQRLEGIFSHSVFNRARFFSVWELKRMLRERLGDVPLTWRTTCRLPDGAGGIARCIQNAGIAQKLPFGTFVGITATLVPRFRTRPLCMRYQTKRTTGIVPG